MKGPQKFEWIIKNLDGEHSWVEVNLNKANIAGEDRVLSFFNNIDERKISEKILNQSYKDLEKITWQQSTLLNTLPANIALIDKDANIIEVNKEWIKFGIANGLPESYNHIGKNYIAYCENNSAENRETWQFIAYQLKKLLKGEINNISHEYTCVTANNHTWYRIEARPYKTEYSSGAVIMHIDITKNKQDEEQIKQSEMLLQEAQRVAKMGSWSRDVISETISWSDELFNVFGTDKNLYKPTLQAFFSLICEKDRIKYKEAIDQLKNNCTSYKIKYSIITPEAERRVIEEIGQAEIDVAGNIKRLYGTAQDITAKEQLESLLNKANHLAQLGGWEMNVLTKNILWSDMTRVIHETEPDFVPSFENTLGFYKDGENKTRYIETMHKALYEGRSWDEEYQIITAKGNEKWIRIIGEAEIINGKCIRIFGSIQDIDQRKKAEQSIRDSEEKRRLIMDASLDVIVCVNNTGKVTYWNSQAERVFGWGTKEVIDKPISEFLVPLSEGKQYYDTVDTLLKTGKTTGMNKLVELTARNRKGIEFPIELTVLRINQQNEEFYCAFIRDITERKSYEENLKVINNRFNLVTKATSDIIWDWDLLTGNVIRSEENMMKQLGFGAAQVNGDSIFWKERIHPEDAGMINTKFDETLCDVSVNYLDCEYRFKKADNTYTYIYDKGYIVRNESGKAIRIIGSTQDISKLKENEKQLQKRAEELAISNKELEQFAYVASHDLLEPLRMVTSFLGQLNKNYQHVLDDRAKKYIHFAVDGAKRMRQIILDLLEYSRVGKHEDKIDPVNLNELVNEVSLLLKKNIEEKAAKVICSNLPVIYNVRSPILQVFQNLIGNAIKYCREDVKPIVQIHCKEKLHHYEISVNDNGIGIDSEYHDKIFIIFQRLHNKDAYSGTGMGLSIVKKIIENLGGNIWLESTEGKGTTFYFTLPKNAVRAYEEKEHIIN